MSIFKHLAISFLTTVTVSGTAAAQDKQPPDLPLTRSEVVSILNNAAQKMEKLYVDPSAGQKVGAALRKAATDTSIVLTKSSLALVPKMNRLLSATHKDAHLAFGYSYEVQEEKEDTLLTVAELERLRVESERTGHGVKRVERLQGNVGYIQMTAFRDPAFASGAIAAAMKLVQGTDALIIDLRDSQGGAPEMVAFLASYFFKEPTLLSEAYIRPDNLTKQAWTASWVPGEMYNAPLYILTNRVTRSAAEGFTYSLQARKRATVVGAVSRGAAHMGRWEIVSPHFAIYVPRGKVTETITKADWEQAGVKPDIVTPPEDALKVAHRTAVERLIAATNDKVKQQDLREVLEALRQ